MSRLRDEPDAMIMNEWGLFFEETTASSLVKVKFGAGTPPEGLHVKADGSMATSLPDVVNIGCVPVGRAIFNARPDVHTVVHAHPHAVMAVASSEAGLLPLSQAAFFLHGQIGRCAASHLPCAAMRRHARPPSRSYHRAHVLASCSYTMLRRYKYDFAYGDEFEGAIAAQFAAGKRAVMLDHHGLYAVGTSAREAWFVVFHLHQACEVQLRAQSAGQPLVMPAQADLDVQYVDMMSSPDYAYDGSREWAGCVRKLNRELPGYEE